MAILLGDALGLVGIRPPWRITGPASAPEWLPSQRPSTVYRKVAPTNTAAQAVIPHSESDKIYDIKYAHRDGRHIKSHRQTETFEAVLTDVVGDAVSEGPVCATGAAPSKGYYGTIFKGRRKYMDTNDGGYTR